MTKWFFALSQASLGHADHDWPGLIRAAVTSAALNTTLMPHFLYDGKPSEFTAEMANRGVKVIHHKVSFLSKVLARQHQIGRTIDPMRAAVMAGAYLRTEIPRLEFDDEYVLYTDCDIMFLSDPDISRYRPRFFSCAPQRYPNDFFDMNSGVMVMNVPAMRSEFNDFSDFIINNFERLNGFDQPALREYYNQRYEPLPIELNWKPYWGVSEFAQVVHFHGPKPDVVHKFITHPGYSAPSIWRELFEENPAAYRYYLERWKSFNKNDQSLINCAPASAVS